MCTSWIPFVLLLWPSALLCLSDASWAAVGTVKGAVTDPTGAVVPHAIVRLGSSFGVFRDHGGGRAGPLCFQQRTFCPSHADCEAQGFQAAMRTDHLKSSVPLTLNLQLALSQTMESVTVTERALCWKPPRPTTHHDIEEEEIERSPSTQPQVALSSLLESVPGVIPEENGRLHVRGSEGQVQYVVDGVPIFENMSGVFSTALDEDDLHSLTL